MGIWVVFNLLGKMFGTEKALCGIVSGASNALDALVYTDEEKAQAAAAQRTEARKMVVAWMAATQGQNLARRLIALSITATWLAMYGLSALMSMVAVWWPSRSDQLVESAAISKGLAQDMNPAVMLILAFYFAAPHMGDIAKVAIGQMQKKSTSS
jgi:hypothetical protein